MTVSPTDLGGARGTAEDPGAGVLPPTPNPGLQRLQRQRGTKEMVQPCLVQLHVISFSWTCHPKTLWMACPAWTSCHRVAAIPPNIGRHRAHRRLHALRLPTPHAAHLGAHLLRLPMGRMPIGRWQPMGADGVPMGAARDLRGRLDL